MGDDVIIMDGILYRNCKVTMIGHTPLIGIELAGRTCYDSFDKSEHNEVKTMGRYILNNEGDIKDILNNMEDIDGSKLGRKLGTELFHGSVLEHVYVTYYVQDVCRGVLQEHARHRIQSLSVKSTRYTMKPLLHAFLVLVSKSEKDKQTIINILGKYGPKFAIMNKNIVEKKLWRIYEDLLEHMNRIDGIIFKKRILNNVAREYLDSVLFKNLTYEEIIDELNMINTKRNVGDTFKYLVDDMWLTNMTVTMNLRALDNYLKLRDKGSAWFLIRDLAKQIKEATPNKLLELFMKEIK